MNLADRAMAENGLSTLDDDGRGRNVGRHPVQASFARFGAAAGPFS
jgi:hypothetical protein